MYSRGNDCPKKVQQVSYTAHDDEEQPHDFKNHNDCRVNAKDDLHREHHFGR